MIRTRYTRLALAAALAALGLLVGCGSDDDGPAKRRPQDERRRQWSGISYADRTVVERLPSKSSSGTGFDRERVWSGEDDWEPYVAVDADRGFVYQFATRWVAPRYKIVVRRSLDGGASWDADQLIYASEVGQADPYAKVADDGTVYAIWLEGWDTVLSKSDDFGETWSAPVSTLGSIRSSDFPSIAISGDGRDVYVAFNRSGVSYIVASHDAGATFSEPVRTNTDGLWWWHGGGDVAPGGDVYFGASTERRSGGGPVSMYVLKSSDGGASWQAIELDVSAEVPDCTWAPGCYFGYLVGVPSVGVDVAGVVLAVYNAGRADGAPQGVWVRRSVDGGASWKGRRRLSRRWPRAHHGFTDVEAGPAAGDFRVVWQGSSRDREDAWNTFYRRTSDGGVRWGRIVRLSDLGTGAPYKSPAGYRFPYGDYLALAVDAQGVDHVIWGEGTSYEGPGGVWYTRRR